MASEQDARLKGMMDSLLRAGIGKAFHDRKLEEAGPVGLDMLAWVKTEAKEHVRNNRSIYVHGPGYRSAEATILLARALHLSGVGCFVTSMISMLEAVQRRDEDALDAYSEAPLLVITRFFNPEGPKDQPLTPNERSRLEQRLYLRLEEKKPLLLHGTKPLRWPDCTWWRPDLLDAVSVHMKTFEVSK